MKLNEDFLARMREATALLRTAGPIAATEAIQRALSGQDAETGTPRAPAHQAESGRAAGKPWTESMLDRTVEDAVVHEPQGRQSGPASQQGQFLSGSWSEKSGTRAYRLYVPASSGTETPAKRPLIVMLHGCKQDPDDFAAGTGMNRLADEHGALVLYPAQSQNANGSNCWNWFERKSQRRAGGEPAILAGMTRHIMQEYDIDPARVYVAGLSAGGAMAGILAAAYPDLFAAVGIHSGLPVGAAKDVASAFGVMKNGSPKELAAHDHAIPVIVFHGDRDHTVHPGNGAQALRQCLGTDVDPDRIDTRIVKGKAESGRTYTKAIFHDRAGAPVAEHWVVHGSGHSWSGGSKAGSYTDPKGPDASAEMMRFFLAHPRRMD
ncbi:extracellular catalytic domain type 1 short-chain-length polyhydroxyalkanoate depolymerase [Noviherbaspirillum galbum]|uniref:PHB depolymerase family esterase n=1 Tax=Noviherbaspirillum galbum TaxID=2709383 RepID=A0A6B3SP32_9BURK|nr:PHB depolymerase family esterase [Noviherbaspirillum galbum]NEX62584.1 PHB depolymerase family esterase [Noviherbaspirillum galbum]